MESKGANQWLVNFDDNKMLTLKSNQLQVTHSQKPVDIHEPSKEDDVQLDSSSFFPLLQKKSM